VVGRSESCDLCIDWDERVSRSHAEIVPIGDEWAIADDGLSANGTFVNGERLTARRRLNDRDVIRVGSTAILFRQPVPGPGHSTIVPVQAYPVAPLTDTQQKVLAALCRPVHSAGGFATPATNEHIASELFLSVDAIKAHLRTLFGKFAIGDLPQNQKRMRLVQLALESGVVDSLLRE
jgi:FHA domain